MLVHQQTNIGQELRACSKTRASVRFLLVVAFRRCGPAILGRSQSLSVLASAFQHFQPRAYSHQQNDVVKILLLNFVMPCGISRCAFGSPLSVHRPVFRCRSYAGSVSPLYRSKLLLNLHRPRLYSSHRIFVSALRDVTVEKVLQDSVVQVRSDLPCDKSRTVSVAVKTESLGGRRRRISGTINIQSSISRVWHVLTSYHDVDRYMPNIVQCNVRERDGVLFLDQIGIISRKLMLRTRMLLRVSEDIAKRSLTFTRVEGRDFSEFVAIFFVREHEDYVRLEYELDAIPFPLFPMYLVERKIVKEVPKMLAAVREEALTGKIIPFNDSPFDEKA